MDYFEHPAISNSKLGWFKKSPAHFDYFQKNPQPETEAFVIGSASHCILFEPEKFKSLYYVLDESQRPNPDKNFLDKENQKWRKDILEAYKHKSIVTLDDHKMISDMMEVIKKNSFAQELLDGCVFEKEVYWTDPITGLECKKKVDGEKDKLRIDYKTAESADPDYWQKKAWSYEYFRQAAFYDLDIQKEFYFIVQEKKPPYGISIHRCSQDTLNYGKDKCYDLMKKIKFHIDNNFWPGYESKILARKPPEATPEELKYFDFEIPMWVLQSM